MKYTVGEKRQIPILAIIVAFIMLCVGIQGIILTSQLAPPLKEEQWFPGNHMHTNLSTFSKVSYYSVDSEENQIMYLVWGIEGLDRSESLAYRPLEIRGTVIYDDSFDLTQQSSQDFVLSTCAALAEIKCDLPGCSGAKATGGWLALPNSISCPLKDFQNSTAGVLPTGSAFLTGFQTFRATKPVMEEGDLSEADYSQQIGFIGGKLKYFAIKFRSAMPKDEPLGNGGPVRDLLLKFAEEQRAKAPASAKGPFVVANEFANWDLAQELLNGLFQGCAIMVPVSFAVLLIATGNVIISFYAVLSVAMIVFCVLGFCKEPMGYSLGIGESIAGVIVIGYSVDYVVHLAHMYGESVHYGRVLRQDRAEFAIRSMGTTVFAGAMTTGGAGIIMFGCFSTFFHKMALLIVITILYSFLFSLGFFMAVLFVVGPEGKMGEIFVCKRRKILESICG